MSGGLEVLGFEQTGTKQMIPMGAQKFQTVLNQGQGDKLCKQYIVIQKKRNPWVIFQFLYNPRVVTLLVSCEFTTEIVERNKGRCSEL